MEGIINAITGVLWSPVMVGVLLLTGLYFSIRTGFIQLRGLPDMLRIFKPGGESGSKEGISSFHALCLSLAGRVGTGNIVGVATAIAIGGPGSVFWMWVVAFLNAATAFAESTLSQVYHFKHKGLWRGGPAAYISEGLHSKWLAVIFAVCTIAGSGLFGTTVQSNGAATAVYNTFGLNTVWGGCIIAAFTGIVVFGGVRRIAKVAGIITPFMALGYILISIIVLVCNHTAIIPAFKSIFTNAFGIHPLVSGIIGTTISMGVKRGLFSNEAGQGTGAISSAAAQVKHPVEQGLAQSFSVYIDTLFICTATALMILVTDSYNIVDPQTDTILLEKAPELGNNYVAFTQAAISTVFGSLGSAFVSISLLFFAFTTLMAYYFYSESSIVYLFRGRSDRWRKFTMNAFNALFIAAIVYGSVKEADFVWSLADLGVGVMVWLNVAALLLLSPIVLKSLEDYGSRKNRK